MSSLEQHIDRSRHHRQPRSVVVDYMRPGFVHPDSMPICGSRGPRIGSEGQPVCKRPVGHDGEHRPDSRDGWGPSMSWGEPW